MRARKTCLWPALLYAMGLAAGALADTIVIRSKEAQGEFVSYENKEFRFRSDPWTSLKEPRTSVQKLVIDPPREVSLVQGAAAEIVNLVGYEQSRFIVEKNGTRREISGMLVKSIAVRSPSAAGGGSAPDDSQARRAIDVSGFEKAALTPQQTAALNRYKSARAKYDAFLGQSTALVARMDRAQGAKREELLNALRVRKNEEQPILRELDTAEKALLAAIPPGTLLPEKPAAAANAGAGPRDRPSREAILPEVGDGKTVIIDTASLEAIPNLGTHQQEAVIRYKAAVADYLALSNEPGTPEADMKIAGDSLKSAQKALLAAFPEVTFSACQ